ncbi:MAG TPA: hypothetical protein DEF72_07905 [Gammaproteobacteria bacterium]|nr:hypothetical protein [Gammaproteobacteria bacterium]
MMEGQEEQLVPMVKETNVVLPNPYNLYNDSSALRWVYRKSILGSLRRSTFDVILAHILRWVILF